MKPTVIPVAIPGHGYEVTVSASYAGMGAAVRARLPGAEAGVVLVTDDTVAPLWKTAVTDELEVARTVVLPAGEAHKGWGALKQVVDGILDGVTDRHTTVVALGGGVVGDVAGLGAALALRGLPLVQLPTTLLAMVDSSVGGKTAINHATGKNLVGAFHQPSLVWANLATLGTLDPRERAAGYGEILKTAVIGDPALIESTPDADEAYRRGELGPLADAVARCVAVKARVVGEDAREQGIRIWLNAGHTVGHGLETALGHGVLRHGHAVALGLVAETAWAAATGRCEEADLPARLVRAFEQLGLSMAPPEANLAAVVRAMGRDKKGAGQGVRVPFAVRAGQMAVEFVRRASLADLASWLRLSD